MPLQPLVDLSDDEPPAAASEASGSGSPRAAWGGSASSRPPFRSESEATSKRLVDRLAQMVKSKCYCSRYNKSNKPSCLSRFRVHLPQIVALRRELNRLHKLDADRKAGSATESACCLGLRSMT